jgi:hypothetical protein
VSASWGRHAQLVWWQYPVRDLRTLYRVTRPYHGSVVVLLAAAVLLGVALTLLTVP